MSEHDDLRRVHDLEQSTARISEVMDTASDVATYYKTLVDGDVPEAIAGELVREFQTCWLERQGIAPEMSYMSVLMGDTE